MPSDLHMHTNFSDGHLSPEELTAAAKAAKLNYIAITDHDTVDGICQNQSIQADTNTRITIDDSFRAHRQRVFPDSQ